jgi:hypothetical protein
MARKSRTASASKSSKRPARKRAPIPESFRTISFATTMTDAAEIKVPMLVLCGEWLKPVDFPIGSSAVLRTDERGEIALNRLGLGLPRRLYIRATSR